MVAVIDGSTNTLITQIPMGNSGTLPLAIGVNSVTNRVYVGFEDRSFFSRAGPTGDEVAVIDGSTNTVITNIEVGHLPRNFGVNTSTNLIYSANEGSNTVSAIDGSNNTVVATIPVGSSPLCPGVNSATNMIYASNGGSNTVSVISGA
jgi:YVTN family beta-propeller protein